MHRVAEQVSKHDLVIFTYEQRKIVCDAFVTSLNNNDVEVVEFCIGAIHWHLLARFQPVSETLIPQLVRKKIGTAKSWTVNALKQPGLQTQWRIWAKRCRCQPVRDRQHQLNVVRYIREHSKRGAVIWSIQKNNQ